MRVVVDTNVLVSGAFWSGAPAEVLLRWAEGRFTLVVTEAIVDEYQRVLLDVSAGRRDDMAAKWVLLVSLHGHYTSVGRSVSAARDPSDDKFLECALSGGAGYVVSGDSDLLVLGEYQGTRIVTPRQFLRLLDERRGVGSVG